MVKHKKRTTFIDTTCKSIKSSKTNTWINIHACIHTRRQKISIDFTILENYQLLMFSWVFDWTLFNDIPDWKTLEEGIQAMAQLHPLVDIHLKCLPLLTKSSKAREGKQQNHKHRENKDSRFTSKACIGRFVRSVFKLRISHLYMLK